MKAPIQHYWKTRLNNAKNELENNNFIVYLADSASDAKDIVQKEILPTINAKTVSWGGSITFIETGLYSGIKDDPNFDTLDVFNKNLSPEDATELRRQALLTDLYITGTNAVTETGKLVNLDMYGNRIAAITFGPKNVIILVGRNKIVTDVEEAISRIKNYAAPVNSMRLDKKTPCVKSAICEDCKSSERICNTWAITEKSFPKGRIKIVLINEDLGF